KSTSAEQKSTASDQKTNSSEQKTTSFASKTFSKINNGKNSYNLTNKTWPTPANYKGHFTNGKVLCEYLAELLNIKLTNYAFGGATSKQQIEKFVNDNARSTMRQKDFSKTLFSVWASGNDYFFCPDMSADPLEVVKSLMDAIRFL
ncbi:22162_t:CDS:2, partial [Racocetra persica]